MEDDDDKDHGPTAAAVLANPELDTALAEKLGQWFGGDASETEPAPEPEVESDWERVLRVAGEAADLTLLDRLQRERRTTVDYTALSASLLPKQTAFQPALNLKLRIPELYEAYVPGDIEDALREANTPQAILRDLHRIEWDFDLEYFPTLIERPKGSATEHRQVIDEALRPMESPLAAIDIRSPHSAASEYFEEIREEFATTTTLGRKDEEKEELP